MELAGELGGMGVVAEVMELEGDYEAAVEQLHRYCQALEERGELAYISTYAPKLGRDLCILGRYNEAEPLARRGRELGGEDDVLTQALWRQVQALVLAHRGEHTEAESLAREAVGIMETTDALSWQADALCDLAEVLEKAGRREESVAVFQEAIERYARKQSLAMVAQVRARLGKQQDSTPLV
jgi:tetratricopeptide (TPR) repeat protein